MASEKLDSDRLGLVEKALSDFVPDVLEETKAPGACIAIVGAGGAVLDLAYGFSDLGARTPLAPSNTVRAGSMSKVYTATAAMQLVERGVVSIDAPVEEYVGFPVRNGVDGAAVQVRDLMTHRSGLTSDCACCSWGPVEPLREHLETDFAEARHDVYRGGFSPKWSGRLGERYAYSNTGIALLGLLVEAANPEGMSLADFVEAQILEPLSMRDTVFAPLHDHHLRRPDLTARLTTGYMRVGSAHLPSPDIHFADWPAGTVLTTPRDHCQLLHHYLQILRGEGGILHADTVRMMLTPHVGSGDGGTGLVWNLANIAQRTTYFAHGGAHWHGWTNAARAYPELGYAIVVSVNQWNLMEDPATPRYLEAELIADFVCDHLLLAPPSARERRDGMWKRSFIAGVVIAERAVRLGIDPIPDHVVAELIPVEDGSLDVEALKLGIRVFPVRPSPEDVVRWVVTQRFVPAEEMRLVLRSVGCAIANPILPLIPPRQIGSVLETRPA